MVRVEHTEVIQRPPDVVFATLCDFEGETEWASDVVSTRLEPPGELKVGTRVFQERRFMGRVVKSLSEIYAYEPPHRIAGRTPPGVPRQLHTVYELTPVDGGTRLQVRIELSGGGAFRFLEPLIQRNLASDTRERFASLKRYLEATS